MTNLRAFAFALPFTVLLAGCPIWSDDGGDRECYTDADCTGDDVCFRGSCEPPECRSDAECGAGDICSGGSCVPGTPCSTDAECGAGSVCVSGMCRPGSRCTADAECGTGEICEGGLCTPGDRSCRTHGDCAAGSYCAAGECTPSGPCSDDAGCDATFWCDFRDTCVPREPGACRADADCTTAGQVCVEGQCRDLDDTCQFDRECAPGTACVNNTCTRICTGDADCRSGESCVSNFCRPDPTECTRSTECASGSHCVDGRCLADCEGGLTCGTDEYCATEDEFCHPEWSPEPFCTEDSDCRTGRVCREGVCRTPCPTMTNMECMRFDSQVPECRADAGGEYLCHAANELTPECRVQSDCGDGRDCHDGACRNR